MRKLKAYENDSHYMLSDRCCQQLFALDQRHRPENWAGANFCVSPFGAVFSLELNSSLLHGVLIMKQGNIFG